MPMSTAWANALLQQAFNNVSLPSDFTTTNIYISLHTADPGIGGNQTTNEVSYTNYARVLGIRTDTTAWTVSGKAVSNAIAQLFAASGGGAGGLVTYGALGELSSGAGEIYGTGQLTQSILVQTNVQPNFPIGSITFTFV